MNNGRDYRAEMKSINSIGQPVMAKNKGDFSARPPKHPLGVIEDEVAIIMQKANPVDDIRYSLHKIRLLNGGVAYRPCYYVWESRVREGQSELRLGWGQSAPIVPDDIENKLHELAFFKDWGPWLKMQNLVNLD